MHHSNYPFSRLEICLHSGTAESALSQVHIKAISRPYIYGFDMALIWVCAKLSPSVTRKCSVRIGGSLPDITAILVWE